MRLDHAVDAAIDHDGDILGHRARHADVLLDDQHRHLAVLGKLDEHLLHLRDDERREPFGGLVHHQQTRIGEQRARDRKHLLLAAGKLSASVVLALGEARERVVDALHRPGALACAWRHLQVLVDRERAPQAAALRHVTDAEPRDLRRIEPRQLVIVGETDRSARRAHQAHDGLAQRGLAHAVAADDRENPGMDRELDALQRMGMAVIDIQAANLQQRGNIARGGVSHDRLQDKAPALRDRTRSPPGGLP